jgi:hypothetical protein
MKPRLTACLLLAAAWARSPAAAQTYQITIDANPAHVINTFSPQAALGVGVDGVTGGAVPQIYTPNNIAKMTAAGLGAVSYRLYTELSVQDWHWNPAGTFSETTTQGYWTSAATPAASPIENTYGYRLPRRGDTFDQGYNDDYSRLDDGDPTTFWKSNPYLSSAYTGESDSLHPQWVVIDLGSARAVNTLKIHWAAPYAVQFGVQYWTGDDPIGNPAQKNAKWVTLPVATVTNGAGGSQTVPLGAKSQPHEYYRLLMTQSSGTCAAAANADPRNCAGYAIYELQLGTQANGAFTDLIVHSKLYCTSKSAPCQTGMYVSSVDPWHRKTDDALQANPNSNDSQEQPGLDTVFQKNGVTQGLPTTIPVPMLYSTPENAAAEIKYLEAQHYSIARVEMGEEPDGQYIAPEDYAALYVQFATAIHAVDPTLRLGGPVFQAPNNNQDTVTWPNAAGETSFTKRFVAYLAAHGAAADLGFFSFEHYPFAGCAGANDQADILSEPTLISQTLDIYKNDLPPNVPLYITETNYSFNQGPAAQHIAGAIWYADLIGTALTKGASGVFLYEYEPLSLSFLQKCGWGTYGILLGNNNFVAGPPLAQFFAARVLTQDWSVAGNAPHALYKAGVTGPDNSITAYPVLRPDGAWSVLLVNRDLSAAHTVQLTFNGPSGPAYFNNTISDTVFGEAQYGWISAAARSRPSPDGPETTTQIAIPVPATQTYSLPAGSITVLRGNISGG